VLKRHAFRPTVLFRHLHLVVKIVYIIIMKSSAGSFAPRL